MDGTTLSLAPPSSAASLMGDFWETYRRLLKRPAGTELSVLVSELNLTDDVVREHAAHLCAIGVAQPVADQVDAWIPVSPEHTLRKHLESERRKAQVLQAELDDLHSLTYSLIADFHGSRIAPNNDYITHVVETEDIRRLQAHVTSGLTSKVKYTCPFRPPKELLQEAKAADQLLIDTGAQLHGIYLTSAASDPHMLSYLNWLVEEGADIRLAPSVPFHCQIYDDSFVFTRYDSTQPGTGMIATKVPEVVRAFDAVFDTMWADAEPFVPSARRGITSSHDAALLGQDTLSAVEKSLLKALASGKKDESVARTLNVSVRTIRRIVAELCDKCEVSSRFELAVVAERQGWLR